MNFLRAIFYRKMPAACPDVVLPDLAPLLSPRVATEPARRSPITAVASEKTPPVPLDPVAELRRARAPRDRLNADAHLLLAAIHPERGQLVAVLAALRHAIYLAPDSAPAHFLMGCLLVCDRVSADEGGAVWRPSWVS